MDFIRYAIDNPVKVTVAAILLSLFGTLSLFQIPKQLTPDVDKPIVVVNTNWLGASPEEVAREIVERQEEKLKNIRGLRKMTSTSLENAGTVTLEFDVGVDKDIALREASEKLRQVSGYPEEVDEPTISASDDDNAKTVAWIMLRGGADVDVSTLKTFVDDKIRPVLERAEGIASTDVYGGREREIQIRVDPAKLAARGITFRDLDRAVRAQNKNISAGTIEQGKRDYTYRTVGEFTTLDEIADTVIAYQPGGPVQVRDVATVIDGFKKQFAFVKSKGEFVIAIPARRETGANVLAAMKNLDRQIDIVNKDILPTLNPSLWLEKVYDETIYINSAIDLVVENIVVGGILAVVVILVYLRSLSSTGIIAVSIPLSVLGTFLIITLMGRTVNVVLLAGLAFAIGMVVDDSIVVLENIYRHRQMGKDRAQAAIDGAREVWGAVLASTLTTMAVFLPVVFIKEEAGQLFADIAIAISAAIGLSLLVSIIAIPPLASRVLGEAAFEEKHTWIVGRMFAAAVTWINRTTLRRLAVVGGLTGASIIGSILLAPDTDYLPSGNRNLVFGVLLTPPGYSVEEFKRMALVVEEGDPADPWDGMKPAWETTIGSPQAANLHDVKVPVGLGGRETVTVKPPPIKNFFFVSFGGGSFMGCTSQSETVVSPQAQVMTEAARRVPGVFAFFSQASLFGSGLTGGGTIEIEVRGDDPKKVVTAAGALSRKLMGSGLGFPRPEPANFDLGRPEIRIVPDRAKSADMGLNVNDIGFIVEACIDGAFVGEYKAEGHRIDLVVKVEGLENATVQEIAQTPIFTPSHNVVPLASGVDIVSTTAPQQINRIEEMQAVTLIVTPPAGTALQTAMTKVEQEIIQPLRASGEIDSAIITSLAGNADKLTTTQRALIGDFRGTVTKPRWFGWSVGAIVAAASGLAVTIAMLTGLTFGLRKGVRVIFLLAAIIVIGFLAFNPGFALMLMQSRAVLAALITYLLLAALFESFVHPFIIMFSVPLAAVGGFLTLHWVHERSLHEITAPVQQLDVLTMLGFIILLGVVVKNAILVVHQALNYIRDHGMPMDQAIVESVRTRTRPIFMTSLTTIFGTAPLVVMTGPGSELYRGIGSVMVGGLLCSTIFTLFVVPALFSLIMEFRERVNQPAAARNPVPRTRESHPLPHLPAAAGHSVQRSHD